ncbi:hypothetical protein [Pontibacter rugosus]|uniref:Uncharacterized protein n=1 Tax=Pontibacter rugosus TaxID=1745966 RepID=A0ABW3SND5_9BACT
MEAGVPEVLEGVSAWGRLCEVVAKALLPAADHVFVKHLPYLRPYRLICEHLLFSCLRFAI